MSPKPEASSGALFELTRHGDTCAVVDGLAIAEKLEELRVHARGPTVNDEGRRLLVVSIHAR